MGVVYYTSSWDTTLINLWACQISSPGASRRGIGGGKGWFSLPPWGRSRWFAQIENDNARRILSGEQDLVYYSLYPERKPLIKAAMWWFNMYAYFIKVCLPWTHSVKILTEIDRWGTPKNIDRTWYDMSPCIWYKKRVGWIRVQSPVSVQYHVIKEGTSSRIFSTITIVLHQCSEVFSVFEPGWHARMVRWNRSSSVPTWFQPRTGTNPALDSGCPTRIL